ncbi:MAG: hypothetical protein K2P85_11265, partial [Flavobacteriaceae bacterium]|nr:hypothetical protein [Flavobacteriaceae bacterium]
REKESMRKRERYIYIYDDITKVPFNTVNKSQRYLDASQIIENSILENKPISITHHGRFERIISIL